ncbi:MAG: ORF6N domain-containing protein [Bdellovibrionia bacterium]
MTTELSVSRIEQGIYFIRGRQVMLDSDLANLYEVKTKILNQAAYRNQKRFPGEDFMFQLLEGEYDSLRSQNVTLENRETAVKSNSLPFKDSLRSQNGTLKSRKGKHRKFLPTVFTEYGAIMLSGILNSDRAIEINVAVVKAFVEFRRKLNTRPALEERMGQLEQKFDQIDQKYDQQSQNLLHAIQQLRPIDTSSPQSRFTAISSVNRQEFVDPAFGKGINNLVQSIQEGVATFYGIKVKDLKATTRLRAISLPRQIAIYLIRKHTQLGFRDIGKIFGGRDHTTTMYAFQKITSSVCQNESIQESVLAIEEYFHKNKGQRNH